MGLDHVKLKTMKSVFAASVLKHAVLIYGARAKIGWLGIRIVCQSGASCIPTD